MRIENDDSYFTVTQNTQLVCFLHQAKLPLGKRNLPVSLVRNSGDVDLFPPHVSASVSRDDVITSLVSAVILLFSPEIRVLCGWLCDSLVTAWRLTGPAHSPRLLRPLQAGQPSPDTGAHSSSGNNE